jgi:hypothetical protein
MQASCSELRGQKCVLTAGSQHGMRCVASAADADASQDVLVLHNSAYRVCMGCLHAVMMHRHAMVLP